MPTYIDVVNFENEAAPVCNFYHLGVMPIKNSKLMPGIGRESTERYSSFSRLFTAPLSDRSAHLSDTVRSRDMLLIKYGGSFPVRLMSLELMVKRSE